jgi:hypothetical protein
MVIRNKASTMLQEEPLKYGRSGRDVGRNWKATLNKEPGLKIAATSEEGEVNRQGHQRTEQETGATSG